MCGGNWVGGGPTPDSPLESLTESPFCPQVGPIGYLTALLYHLGPKVGPGSSFGTVNMARSRLKPLNRALIKAQEEQKTKGEKPCNM